MRGEVPLQGTSLGQRLIEAVWTIWEFRGHASISARVVAQRARVPLSTLYNHFASLEHLCVAAQAEALEAAKSWCNEQIAHLPLLRHQEPGTGADLSLGPIMAALIDDWTRDRRALAFAWREGFLLARRSAVFEPCSRGWRELWAGFWQKVCDRCGLGQFGEMTSFVFEAEAGLHLLNWRRNIDRACLDELCQGWASWLSGNLAAEGPWRRRVRLEAEASSPELPTRDNSTLAIASAAAEIVEQLGVARLTHRSVAASADVSLGAVSNRFRTVADLIRAAFEIIYLRVSTSPVAPFPPVGQHEALRKMIPAISGQQMAMADRLAIEELMLAVARDKDFSAFAPQLRYSRGRGADGLLQMLAGDEARVSPLDAAILSNLLSGLQRAVIAMCPEDKISATRKHMLMLMELLQLSNQEPAHEKSDGEVRNQGVLGKRRDQRLESSG